MVIRSYRQKLAKLGIIPAVLMIVAAWPAVIPAQADEDPVLVLRRAEVTFQEGDYEGAVQMLEPLLTRTDLTKDQKAKSHELLAFCYDALDKEDEIRSNVRALYEMNRKYSMNAEWMDDRMQQIVDEVQSDLANQDADKAAAAATGTTAADEPTTPPDHMTAGETSDGGGGSKTKYYVAGAVGAAALVAVLLLAGGGDDEDEQPAPLDTLGTPPAHPTRR